MKEMVPLRGEKKLSSCAHKAGSWYLLGVLFKVSSEHPCHFYMGIPPGSCLKAAKYEIQKP